MDFEFRVFKNISNFVFSQICLSTFVYFKKVEVNDTRELPELGTRVTRVTRVTPL